MITYLWRLVEGFYVEAPTEIDPEYWSGQIGSTVEDFYNDKWIPLSDEQVAYHNEHPYASVSEVINMSIPEPPVRTVEQAKMEKKHQIESYDKSSAVNSFSINGTSMWLNVNQRQQLATQINVNEIAGNETMTRWFNETSFTFPVSTWKQMLVALELYAGEAINVTESHKAAVDALNTVEDIDNYNFKVGYPNKLNF